MIMSMVHAVSLSDSLEIKVAACFGSSVKTLCAREVCQDLLKSQLKETDRSKYAYSFVSWYLGHVMLEGF